MSKKEKIKKIISIKNLLIAVVVVLLVIQYIQVQIFIGNMSFLSGKGSFLNDMGHLKENNLHFATDLSEIRDYLRLPKKNYDGLAVKEDKTDKNEKQIQLAMFKFITNLSTTKTLDARMAKNISAFEALVKSEELANVVAKDGLTSEVNELSLALYASAEKTETPILKLYVDADDGNLYRQSVKDGAVIMKVDEESSLVTDFTSYLTKNIAAITSHTNSLNEIVKKMTESVNSEDIQNALKELALRSDLVANEDDESYIFKIIGKLDDELGSIVLDKQSLKISMIDAKNSNVSVQSNDLSTSLVPFLKNLDNQTFIEKKYMESLAEIKDTINDKGFQLLLKEGNLTISKTPREESDRIYFDILDASGKVINSIILEKATGVVNVVDSNGANSENILFFDPQFKKKTLKLPTIIPKYGSTPLSEKDSFNILIAGKNGSLVDTMIFAHINEKTREINMISIPRDLFYQGRKINALPFFYGMPELKKVISNLTGYKLDKYILVDMYAFIDVIDLIGGIDVTLKTPVIDPTYRIVDNGVEGTLNYAPGDYHFSGVQALRIARSRHTSSDFARAERQQLILKSIQSKAQNMGFGDAKTIYEIAKAVLKRTESDISFDEAISYFFRYQDYKIASSDVISSGNILYSPPYTKMEDCQPSIDAATASGSAAPACAGENHAYTLIPRDNNWDLIKWFFRDHFGK